MAVSRVMKEQTKEAIMYQQGDQHPGQAIYQTIGIHGSWFTI